MESFSYNNSDSTTESLKLQTRIVKSLESIDSIVTLQVASEDSIFNGNLGLAIYYYTISEIRNKEKNLYLAVKTLQETLERVKNFNSSLKSYHYSTGLSGLGACIQYFVDRGIIDYDFHKEFRFIDDFILENALDQINEGTVEYLNGGTGALLYFNMRKCNDLLLHRKEQLLNSIFNQITKDPWGVRLPTRNSVWVETDVYDLSLSHGLCGVMHILLSILKMQNMSKCKLIESYLNKASSFVASLKRMPKKETGNFSCLPSFLEITSTPEQITKTQHWPNSTLAWCYGDLGWVLFFYRFGKFTGNTTLLEFADEIGIYTTSRKTTVETNSSTSHFCHGHSGLAYFYKTLFEITGKIEYRNAADFWINETLRQLEIELRNEVYKHKSKETSFLKGLVGISLVLGSFLPGKDVNWQRFLLL